MTYTDRRQITFDERVEIYKVLGNKTRLEIFEKIVADGHKTLDINGEMCITEVASMFSYSLPTISMHLTILKRAGLIKTRKEGKKIFINVNIERSKKLFDSFQHLLSLYEQNHSVR